MRFHWDQKTQFFEIKFSCVKFSCDWLLKFVFDRLVKFNNLMRNIHHIFDFLTWNLKISCNWTTWPTLFIFKLLNNTTAPDKIQFFNNLNGSDWKFNAIDVICSTSSKIRSEIFKFQIFTILDLRFGEMRMRESWECVRNSLD